MDIGARWWKSWPIWFEQLFFWNSRVKKWHDMKWRRGNGILKLNFEAAAELIRENLFLYMRACICTLFRHVRAFRWIVYGNEIGTVAYPPFGVVFDVANWILRADFRSTGMRKQAFPSLSRDNLVKVITLRINELKIIDNLKSYRSFVY